MFISIFILDPWMGYLRLWFGYIRFPYPLCNRDLQLICVETNPKYQLVVYCRSKFTFALNQRYRIFFLGKVCGSLTNSISEKVGEKKQPGKKNDFFCPRKSLKSTHSFKIRGREKNSVGKNKRNFTHSHSYTQKCSKTNFSREIKKYCTFVWMG